ncbi:MAG: chloride channel protein [Bacteroidota bacterium]
MILPGIKNKIINEKTFIIIASLVVGILSGLASVVLKNTVRFFHTITQDMPQNLPSEILKFFLPLIGILLSVFFVRAFLKGKITPGLSNIIYSIVRRASDLPAKKTYSHLITSAFTVGFGGSVGLEAPIVVTGAAIGSNVAKKFKLNYQVRTLLLACGSAAGISSIFNSPIAGVIFAFEVLLPDLSIPYFIPLLISSATAAVLSKFLYSGQLFFLVTVGWKFSAIPYYILLGILCGFISLYMIRTTLYIERYFHHEKRVYLKAILGGLVLCALIFVLPPLFGEGYNTVTELLVLNYHSLFANGVYSNFGTNDVLVLLIVFLSILIKPIATSVTLGSGGNGGIIAPSLITGALVGFFMAHLTGLLHIAQLNHVNFIAVGMAGILSGVIHAPLTGIFLIAEITGGYVLIVPLMIVSAISYFISRHFQTYSVYTSALAEQGIHFRSTKDKSTVHQLKILDIVESNIKIVEPNFTLRKLISIISNSKQNIYPVVDSGNKLLGIINLDDVREILLNSEIYDVILVYEIMKKDFITVDAEEDFETMIKIFEENRMYSLPVVQNDEYVGIINKAEAFNKYASVLLEETDSII